MWKWPFKSREQESKEEFIWCLVGNVISERFHGEEKEIKRGAKHFNPGAKVYCFPPLWGDGYERVKVIGQHRMSKRYITLIMEGRHIENFRKQRVYKEAVIGKMIEGGGWNYTKESEMRLDSFLRKFN